MFLARFFIALYAIWAALFILNGISDFVFSDKPLKERALYLSAGVMLAIIWPIAICSVPGRMILLKQSERL